MYIDGSELVEGFRMESESMKCNIVKDLLPNYVDELCSEETKKMVEEHIKDCEQCRGILSLMKGGEYDNAWVGRSQNDSEEDKKEMEKIEKAEEKCTPKRCSDESDMAVLRTMKKIVWRRVVAMLASILLSIAAIGLIIALVLGQVHPEWELFNYEQYQMRCTAKNATQALAEGDMETFFAGYKNALLNNYYHTEKNKKVIGMVQKRIRKLYDANLKGGEYSIRKVNSGWAHFNNAVPMYTVEFLLECGEYKLYFTYLFIEEDIYLVECDEEDGDDTSAKLADSIGGWCGYLSHNMYSNGDLHQIILNNLNLSKLDKESSEEEKKEHCELRAALTFNRDCSDVKSGYRVFDGGYPDYLKQWGSRIYEFQQNHTLEEIWVQDDGMDEEAQKELRTILWKFTDSRGMEGVMEKRFYYGPGGYEPVDDKEKVYGDGLSKETIAQLEGMFD